MNHPWNTGADWVSPWAETASPKWCTSFARFRQQEFDAHHRIVQGAAGVDPRADRKRQVGRSEDATGPHPGRQQRPKLQKCYPKCYPERFFARA